MSFTGTARFVSSTDTPDQCRKATEKWGCSHGRRFLTIFWVIGRPVGGLAAATALSAERVQQLIAEGAQSGEVHDVHAAFVPNAAGRPR